MRANTLGLLLVLGPLVAQAPSRRPPGETMAQIRHELAAARAELQALQRLELPAPSVVSGTIGLDAATHYLFRGIPQEDQGVILQPSVELRFRLFETDAQEHAIDLAVGSWNSLHTGPTRRGGSIWYEDDVYAGIGWTFARRLVCRARYTAYHSPNDSFDTVQEVAVSTTFDDRGLWWCGALSPSANIAFEVAGQADAGRRQGIVAEVGIRPTCPLAQVGPCHIDALLPCKVGLSIADYYEVPGGGGGRTFGYVDLGLAVGFDMPLSCGLASWHVEAGLHYIRLGSTNEARNGGDADELVATFGVSTAF